MLTLNEIEEILSVDNFSKVECSKDYSDLLKEYPYYFQELYFKSNPKYLSQYNSLKDIFKENVVTLRDGLWGLIYFFFSYPKPPENNKTTVIIPKKFKFLIPKSWSKFIALYEIQGNSNNQKNEEIIICGPIHKGVFLNQKWKEMLSNVIDNSNYKRIHILNEPSLDIFFSHPKRNDINNFIQEMFIEFGERVALADFDYSFLWKKRFSGIDIYPIDNMNIFFYDYSFVHDFCLKGGDLITPAILSKNETSNLSYKLSPNHNIVFSCLSEKDIGSFEKIFFNFRLNGHKLNYKSDAVYHLYAQHFKGEYIE